jgi:RNA polymerase sigma factor (sigma-70 family)
MGEMQPKSDAQLLREYAESGSESAFTELVTRHTDLVYSAALRQVSSSDLARDVAQNVFTSLARGARTLAGKLNPDASLAGWLCRCTRNLALNLRRDDFRRHSRERQAMETLHPSPETAPDWARLRPLLDEAISGLNEADHDALALRFFKNQDLRSVGLALGMSDDTAQKRVARALEKLREHLARHGITTTGAALAMVISANAVQAAPIGLAATISTAATLAGTTIATSATATATKAIAMTALQKTVITVTLAVVAGAGIYETRQAVHLREENQLLQQQQAPLAKQIGQLQRERDDATNRLAGLLAENLRSQSNPNQTELLKLRGEVGMLRQKANDLAQLVRDLQNAGKPNPSAYQTNFFPLGSLQFAGYATPEAALQSGLWAKSVGNEKVWLDGMAPDVADGAKNKYVQGQSDAERSQFLINQTTNWIGSRILNEIPLADDEVLMPTEIEMLVNGATNTFTSMEVLKRINGEWKLFDEYNENGLKPKAP